MLYYYGRFGQIGIPLGKDALVVQQIQSSSVQTVFIALQGNPHFFNNYDKFENWKQLEHANVFIKELAPHIIKHIFEKGIEIK